MTWARGRAALTDIVLTLDSAIPSAVAVNSHVVENITYTPEVNIHDNVFKETRPAASWSPPARR